MSQENRLRQVARIINWPREKKRKFQARYDQWLLFRLNKYGPGDEISHEESIADRILQVTIDKVNSEGDF